MTIASAMALLIDTTEVFGLRPMTTAAALPRIEETDETPESDSSKGATKRSR